MARLPPPPPVATLAGLPPVWQLAPAGTLLFRVYFRAIGHALAWNRFRAYGPTGARFDHHSYPKREQARRVLYAARSFQTCLAEVFQRSGVIDAVSGEPAVVAFRTTAPLRLVDLTGHWPTQAGASMAINSGSHSRARGWSRAIYAAYPDAQGLWYCSSMDANNACVALYERAESGVPNEPSLHLMLADPRLRVPLTRCATALGYRVVL